MDQSLRAHDFVIEWLNHFNVIYEADVELNSTLTLDFLIKQFGVGIYIVNWKRPISVQIANKAIQLQREFELDQVFLIAKEISEPARKTLGKFGKNITTVHPNGLSELAISLANVLQPQNKHVTVSN